MASRSPRPSDRSHRSRGQQQRELRIIAGRWRGRRFRFPPLALRPTPDRVRETLFNWLQPRIVGARCLDLYAGSGALGLEALSRGAAAVSFVDCEPAAAAALTTLLQEWGGEGGSVHCMAAQRFLAHPPAAALAGGGAFDIVFLDPPFDSAELASSSAALAAGWLAADARIYVEHARAASLPPLPPGWQALRAGSAGEVGYHLLASAGGTAT